jgi:hypothetical protein
VWGSLRLAPINSNNPKRCSHPDCTTPDDKATEISFANEQQINEIFGVTILNSDNHVLFCRSHYQLVYRIIRKQSSTPCETCGARPLCDTKFTRHCPDSSIINDHMVTAMGLEMNITPLDVICSTCYKLHLHIINLRKVEKNNESLDAELQMLIDDLQKQKNEATNKTIIALATVGGFVANELLNQRAL